MIESPQSAPSANYEQRLKSVRLKKRCDRVVKDVGDADDFPERPAVAPIRLLVCPNKLHAPANALGRFEQRNVAAQDALYETGHPGLEEYGSGRNVESGRPRQFGCLCLGLRLDWNAQKHPRADESTLYGGPVPTARP
jgi:hypothetical protein